MLAALEEFPLDPTALLHIHVTLFNYVRGLATALEPEAEAERDTGMTNDEWMDRQEAAVRAFAGSGRFANFLRGAMASEIDLDLDSLFEFGLVRLLDGLAVFLEYRSGGQPSGACSSRCELISTFRCIYYMLP